jgi:hypothetical protein
MDFDKLKHHFDEVIRQRTADSLRETTDKLYSEAFKNKGFEYVGTSGVESTCGNSSFNYDKLRENLESFKDLYFTHKICRVLTLGVDYWILN